MKLVSLIIFLLIFHESLPQTTISIEGKVTDGSTKEPLEYVSIYLAGTSFGTVTNQSGEFIFKSSPTGEGDIVVFSHLGYKPFQIRLKEVTEKYLVISLEPQSFELNEIVVKPLDPLDIVNSCISKIPQNYNLSPHTVQGFQREYVKQSDKFIQLLEVAFETKTLGSGGGQFSNVLEARYVEDKKEKDPLWSPSRGGFYTFGWTSVSGIENQSQINFLGVDVGKKSDLAKYYEFQLKESITSDNKHLYVIGFDQRRNVKRPLLKGTLYIDSESYAIVKLTYELSSRGIKNLKSHETWGGKKISKPPKKIDIKEDRSEITYRKYGSKWYLNTLVMDTEFDASLVFFRIVQSQKTSLKFHSERVVTAIDTTAISSDSTASNIADIGSIPTLQNFIKKGFETYDETNGEKWINLNFIRSDTSTSLIAKQLNINNQQWELYRRQQDIEKAIARSNYTSRQLTEDLDYLKETLEKVHPGLYWYTDKVILDNEFEAIKNKLKKTNTETEFFQLLSPLIEKIHCGHTKLNPSFVQAEYRKLYNRLFPFDLFISGDTAIVTASYNSIMKRSRVIEINGYGIHEVVGRIKSGSASDGFNHTYKEFLLNNEFSSLFAKYFSGKDTFDVKIQDSNGRVGNLEIIGKIENDEGAEKINYAEFFVYDSLQTAMLKIPSFSSNQDLPMFLQKSFKQIESMDIKNLIIDLRNNQGGRDEYGLLLFSYLAMKPFRYYKNISVATVDTTFLNRLYFGDIPFNSAIPDYVSYIQEENGSYFYTSHANLGLHQPKENAFKGSVYILNNGGTFSTAAEFASIAHNSDRAVFIGEETGGGYYGNCSLGTPTLTLPNSQIRITIPIAKYQLAVSKSVPAGHGVVPDHQTYYYSHDILQNRDKDLELCLSIIAQDKN